MAASTTSATEVASVTGGPVGEGAKYWLHVLTEIKNRGVGDVLMVVCDGLTGLPDAVSAVWPQTITQTCVVHLLRNSFRYAGRQHYEAIAKALRPVYTAPTETAAMERFLEFAEAWGERYPAIVRLWENAWAEFVPFLSFDVEIRKIICTTNAIESIQASKQVPFHRVLFGLNIPDVGWVTAQNLARHFETVDRLTQWSRPGLLCIGDAAHARHPGRAGQERAARGGGASPAGAKDGSTALPSTGRRSSIPACARKV